MEINYDVITGILKHLNSKKAWVAIFADIIEIVIMFIKKTLKTQLKEVKRNYALKCNLYLYFLI